MSSAGSTPAASPGGLRAGAAKAPVRAVPRWRRHLLAYLLLAPLVLVMLLVIGYPLVNTVLLAFRDVTVIGRDADWVGFENFSSILGDSAFWDALRRSLIWLVGNILVQTLLAFGAALLMHRTGWLSKQARVWVLLPWVIPTVAVAIIWQWMLNSNYGIVSHVLEVIGVISSPLNVFGKSSSALFGLILVNAWHWFPLSAVIILGALQTVPDELYEAAKVDGASAWRTFWSITFPMLAKVLFALGLVGALWSFNTIDTILLITRGGPSEASTTAPIFVYDQAFRAFRASEAAAAATVSVLILAIFALLYIRFARPKEH